jgi:hypothetical protein
MTTGEPAMSSIYPPATPEIARRRRDLAPNQQAALEALGKAVFADGALPTKTKQIIAVAVAHVTPKMKARLADFGGTPLVVSPADFGRLIADETEKWGNVIRALNIKAD